MGDCFGQLFKISTWGESHGGGVGVVIDGCPAGVPITLEEIQTQLDRRRPGQSRITTQRKESDTVEILSGCFEGKTTGTALAMLVRNQDARPQAYDDLKNLYRPSHADWSYEQKYGLRDWRGGGRSSARETIGRVAAGAIAKKILHLEHQVETLAYVERIHNITAKVDREHVSLEQIEANDVRCPDQEAAQKMIDCIKQIRKQGDSVGGWVSAVVRNVPAGLGEPVFDKLTADLAKAMMSLPATRAIEFGLGFESTELTGSQHNDSFFVDSQTGSQKIRTRTNYSAGIQGGISNGEDIYFRVAFKPTATINFEQDTVTRDKEAVKLKAKGRHDPCVLPRAIPMVEAMTNLVLVDHLLRQKAKQSLT